MRMCLKVYEGSCCFLESENRPVFGYVADGQGDVKKTTERICLFLLSRAYLLTGSGHTFRLRKNLTLT